MSVNKVFDVDLDIKRPSSHRDFTVVNGDNGNRINVTLMDGDSPVDLTGCRIIAAFSRADGSTSLQDSGVQNGGILEHQNVDGIVAFLHRDRRIENPVPLGLLGKLRAILLLDGVNL